MQKEVDVINIDFAPDFITTLDLTDEERFMNDRERECLKSIIKYCEEIAKKY